LTSETHFNVSISGSTVIFCQIWSQILGHKFGLFSLFLIVIILYDFHR